MIGTWEIILIVLVILLIFGGKKIPELMRGLGKGVKSFKDGVNGKEDIEAENEKQEAEKKEEVKKEEK
jgi:sec-independent protein translocase protein TatA